jgi:hypothetical protein
MRRCRQIRRSLRNTLSHNPVPVNQCQSRVFSRQSAEASGFSRTAVRRRTWTRLRNPQTNRWQPSLLYPSAVRIQPDPGAGIVWRPRTLGSVIADRTVKLARPGRRPTAVRVRFGRPVRAPRPERGDPWWCPVDISGLGTRRLERVAGVDSLQALTLAMELMTRILPIEAERAGGHLEWLGERERLIFGHTIASDLLAQGLQNFITGLAEAIDALENAGTSRVDRSIAGRLRALIASGGHTADPGRVPPSELAKVRAAGSSSIDWRRKPSR